MSDSLTEALDLALFWEYRQVLLKGLAFNFYVFACAAVLAVSGFFMTVYTVLFASGYLVF